MLRARAWHFPSFLLVVSGLIAVCAGGDALAQGAARAVQQDDDSDALQLRRPITVEQLRALRSFFERVDVSGVASSVSAPRAPGSRAMDAVLASLPGDWDAPFAFVQGAIRHVPYAGTVRGAGGALESRGGNALDQALLLQALLEARGVPARLVRGRLQWDDAARLVVGTDSPPAPLPGDAWPRWLETAAEHWWIQAQRDGEWMDLDPSFTGAAAGEVIGVDGRPVERVPDDMRARARIELLRGDLVLAEAELPTPALVGQTLRLTLRAQSESAVALWRTTARELHEQGTWLRRTARRLGMLPEPARATPRAAPDAAAGAAPAGSGAPQVTIPPPLGRPSFVERVFLDPGAGPWHARLQLPGRTLEAGPFERSDLDSLLVRITVNAPQAPAHVVRAPWGGGTEGTLGIVVTAGEVPDERLITHARAMYRALDGLAGVEQAARVDMRPPIDYWRAQDALAGAARAEWDRFAAAVPEVLGWVLLRGVEGVSARSAGSRVVRPGLRVVAVRWQPPEAVSAGTISVLMSDPVVVGRLTGGASAAALRLANGVLQSAVFSQVLNRLTDRAPETAFDVTLLAIGTGQALRTFEEVAELPQQWPPSARAEAAVGLAAGYRVLAPASFGEAGAGWWNIGLVDGEAVGWVPGPQAAMHGRVDIGLPGRLDRLETLLASLPALHRALRWLSELPGSGPTSLSSVPAAACGSATVAAEAMADSMPAGWPRPAVRQFCAPG